LPKALEAGFKLQRYGAPFAGGWMQWPLKWLTPVQIAMNVYDTLTAFNAAMERFSEMNGKARADAERKWMAKNGRLVQRALAIQRLRDELENDGNGN
jgi:hypothetical protein